MAEARTVSAFLRSGVREKYGKDAEKLVEFGLRVFRGNRRREEEEPEAPAPDGEKAPAEAAAGSSSLPKRPA